MTTLVTATTFDDILANKSNTYEQNCLGYGYTSAAKGYANGNSTIGAACRGGWVLLPALPSGVNAYIPVEFAAVAAGGFSSTTGLLCEMTNLGNIVFNGGAPGTYTAGSTMPTRTELNASNTTSGALWAEVTTALGGTNSSYICTYQNQSGVGSQATPSVTATASSIVGSGSFLTLAVGDSGVQKVTNCVTTGGTSPTGTITFWGVIPVCQVPISPNGITIPEALITSGAIMRLTAQTLGLLLMAGGSSGGAEFCNLNIAGTS